MRAKEGDTGLDGDGAAKRDALENYIRQLLGLDPVEEV